MALSFVFGQDSDCDVQVEDPYVSNRHARVFEDGNGAVWVEDLGSTNGAFVERDGERSRIVRCRLFPGDVLWLGGRTSIPWTAGEASRAGS